MSTQVEPSAPTQPAPRQQFSIGRFARRYVLQIGIIAVMLVMWIFLIFAGPRTFQNKEIYISFAESVPFYGIMALPITLLVIAQEIDLSFGSIMAVGVMAFVTVFNATGSPLLGLVACLVAGAIAGLLNGFLVVIVGIPSLIATIGTQFFWRGVVLVLAGASNVPLTTAQTADPLLYNLLVGRLFGVLPAQFIWMILIAVAIWVLLNRHRFGAHVYLIGDNANSARLMGINVSQRRILMFGLVGLASAFAGIITSYDVGSFFSSLGGGYLLPTLSAVFLGGTSVLGGTGTILGTFIGCIIIGAIEPGVLAIGTVDIFGKVIQLTGDAAQLLYGLVIVVSVGMHSLMRRRIR